MRKRFRDIKTKVSSICGLTTPTSTRQFMTIYGEWDRF